MFQLCECTLIFFKQFLTYFKTKIIAQVCKSCHEFIRTEKTLIKFSVYEFHNVLVRDKE
jgi:hypothetical protein